MKKFIRAVLAVWRFISFLLLLLGIVIVSLMVVLTLWNKNIIPYQNYAGLVLIISFVFILIGSFGIEKSYQIMKK